MARHRRPVPPVTAVSDQCGGAVTVSMRYLTIARSRGTTRLTSQHCPVGGSTQRHSTSKQVLIRTVANQLLLLTHSGSLYTQLPRDLKTTHSPAKDPRRAA